MDMEKDFNPSPTPSLIPSRVEFFENRLLSYREAAEYLCISESYLRRLKAEKQIAYVPIGSRNVRFRVASLSRWIEKREMK
jgi:excisionase family DNA binding protein